MTTFLSMKDAIDEILFSSSHMIVREGAFLPPSLIIGQLKSWIISRLEGSLDLKALSV
jgi:hypothetical protein